MQRISLDHLPKLIAEGAFMPPQSESPPELSGTTAILLVFQANSQHEEITDVYVGLIVHRVQSRLYTLDHIQDFVKDIEVDLQAARDVLRPEATLARGMPFASLSANSGVPCPSPQTHLTALSTRPAM